MVAEVGGKTDRNRGSLIPPTRLARLSIGLIITLTLLAAGPASKPSDQIKTWVNELADSTPSVRANAIERLMELKAGDLPKVQEAIKESGPLLPSQRFSLYDIVLQVYLSELPYDAEPDDTPFIGLSWRELTDDTGVAVAKRLQGFPAYQKLRDGDMIQGIKEIPGSRFTQYSMFIQALQTFRAGQTVTLQLLRDGQSIEVAIQLRKKPAGLDPVIVDDWFATRQAIAEEYWQQNFAPLMGNGAF